MVESLMMLLLKRFLGQVADHLPMCGGSATGAGVRVRVTCGGRAGWTLGAAGEGEGGSDV